MFHEMPDQMGSTHGALIGSEGRGKLKHRVAERSHVESALFANKLTKNRSTFAQVKAKVTKNE
jgi:hypothetical protein